MKRSHPESCRREVVADVRDAAIGEVQLARVRRGLLALVP